MKEGNNLKKEKNNKVIVTNIFSREKSYSKIFVNLKETKEIKQKRILGKIKPNINFLIGNLIRYNNTILIFIFILIITLSIQKITDNLIQYRYSNITLKVRGNGTKKIFSSDIRFKSTYYPDKIYINEVLKSPVKYSYYLNPEVNNIKLIWNNRVNSCYLMFYKCSDIIEVDLSEFDSSEVTSMGCMFEGCSSLISLNLSSLNTSKVDNMGTMFKGCESLISLNLSNFDTSNVIYLDNMFNGCSKLTSLNLSNFNNSKTITMKDMFRDCSKLKTLCLDNFGTSSVVYWIKCFLSVHY